MCACDNFEYFVTFSNVLFKKNTNEKWIDWIMRESREMYSKLGNIMHLVIICLYYGLYIYETTESCQNKISKRHRLNWPLGSNDCVWE